MTCGPLHHEFDDSMTGNKPLLYGKYLSPYVRRVGVSLHVLGISFERSIISAVDDEGKREAVNPVGRVPALQLETGEILVDSAAILDHYDEMVGPKLSLVPATGDCRRTALQLLAIATGAIDRSMTANAERRRTAPEDGRKERLLRQCRQGFEMLEEKLAGQRYFDGNRLQQTDITCSVGFGFVNHIFPGTLPKGDFPALAGLVKHCEALTAFVNASID